MEEDRWSEILINLKWPHEGFTLGFDYIKPNDLQEDLLYYSVLLYLGPLTLIFNWGNHSWND